jgi:hypothetical protein
MLENCEEGYVKAIAKKKGTTNVFKWLDWLLIKEKVGFALWPMLRELWYLRLIRLYATFFTKTTRERELMNSWCWS